MKEHILTFACKRSTKGEKTPVCGICGISYQHTTWEGVNNSEKSKYCSQLMTAREGFNMYSPRKERKPKCPELLNTDLY